MVVVSIPIINVIDIHLATIGNDDMDTALRMDVYVAFGDIHSMELGVLLITTLIFSRFSQFAM